MRLCGCIEGNVEQEQCVQTAPRPPQSPLGTGSLPTPPQQAASVWRRSPAALYWFSNTWLVSTGHSLYLTNCLWERSIDNEYLPPDHWHTQITDLMEQSAGVKDAGLFILALLLDPAVWASCALWLFWDVSCKAGMSSLFLCTRRLFHARFLRSPKWM